LFFVREPKLHRTGATSKPKDPVDVLMPEASGPVGQVQGAKLLWSRLPGRLKGFFAIVFLFALANSSNQFLLLRAKSLGFQPATVLLLYLAYNISYGLLSYPAGSLSDKVGRKVLLVIGYAFYGVVYLGFAFVRDRSYVWLLFLVYGVYIAMTEGVEKALVADLAPKDLRATFIGLHSTLSGIGLLPASIVAGLLWKSFGAPAPFLFGGCLGLLASLALWLVV
jgi:MFS family permease